MKASWITTALNFKFGDSAILCAEQLECGGAKEVKLNEDKTILSGTHFEPAMAQDIKGFVYGSFSIKSITVDENGVQGWVKTFNDEGEEVAHVDLTDVLSGLQVKTKETMIVRVDSDHPIFTNLSESAVRQQLQEQLDSGASTLADLEKQLIEQAVDQENAVEVHTVSGHINQLNQYDPCDFYLRLEVAV